MRHSPFVFLFVVFISVITIINCCKKNTCLTCPPPLTDTTSHSFVFQQYVFGESGSSMLHDVAIINDTLAYAVGEIHLNGTLYNLAKWNGNNWELKMIQSIICGSNSSIVSTIFTIYAFNANDIWYSDGAEMIHWNGTNYTNDCSMNSLLTGAINKIWGTSDANLYIVGGGGSIAHYNGSLNGAGSWTKIESGTSLDIRDIWGAQNTKTGSLEIYATAGNPLISPDRAILQINGSTAQSISSTGIYNGLNGLWFSPGQYYWIVGDGAWEKHPTLNVSTWKSMVLTMYTTYAVRGNALNDVFMCGASGEILHYNGVTWKSYLEQTGIINGWYLSLAVKGNTVIAVGENAPYATILMGKRQ